MSNSAPWMLRLVEMYHHIAVVAATTISKSCTQFTQVHYSPVATGAAAFPTGTAQRPLRQCAQSSQPTEYLPSQVHSFRSAGTIQLLLSPRRPATVPRFIVPVIVNAIKGILRSRTWSHVRKEVCKAVPPTSTYGNSTSTVAVVPLIMGVGAAVRGCPPRLVLWRYAHLETIRSIA